MVRTGEMTAEAVGAEDNANEDNCGADTSPATAGLPSPSSMLA
jgi:hypothetical protein